jgi:CHASE2 domain-containing sensor protein
MWTGRSLPSWVDAGRKLRHRFVEHVRNEWPAVLFVPALIFVLHHYNWLHAVDGYAFLSIGNLTALLDVSNRSAPAISNESRAAVVLIDPETHEDQYAERSPLDRCTLLTDLGTVYAAKPTIVAIDIDISPALWLGWPASTGSASRKFAAHAHLSPTKSPKDELQCQQDLYNLIREQSALGIGTVLMAPFKAASSSVATQQCLWRLRMERPLVRFGRADLPVEYGLVLKHFEDINSFSAVAFQLHKDVREARKARREIAAVSVSVPRDRTEETSVTQITAEQISRCELEAKQPGPSAQHRERLINPRVYATAVCPVPLKVSAAPAEEQLDARRADTWCPLNDSRDANLPFAQRLNDTLRPLEEKVVFFGAAYGPEDTFLTPLGELYGVEIQAASYLSWILPIEQKERLAFLGDVLIALAFSMLISFFWLRYFRYRLSDHSRDRQLAVLFILGLTFFFSLLVVAACAFSFYALRGYGVWLSPVPIAVGMLIDGFVLGSVHEALHESTHQKRELIKKLIRSVGAGSFEETAATALKQHRREAHTWQESIGRFFFYDWRRLMLKRQHTAAIAIVVRRLIWLTCIALALAFAFFEH